MRGAREGIAAKVDRWSAAQRQYQNVRSWILKGYVSSMLQRSDIKGALTFQSLWCRRNGAQA
jgi:hypothetical protein